MDYFSWALEGLSLIGQCVMHVGFAGRLAGKKSRGWHFAAYLLWLCAVEWVSVRTGIPETLAIAGELLGVYILCRSAMGNRKGLAPTAAVLAVYVSQLSFGVMNSVEVMVFPYAIGKPALYFLVITALLVSFAICAGCYALVLRFMPLPEDGGTPFAGVVLIPVMFFFAAELYILDTSYSVLPAGAVDAGKHTVLLILQSLGLAALICTLYAYRQLRRNLQAREELRSLAQAARAQKIYIAEARTRYEQTRAFRHDIANHLTVLDGLLGGGRWDEGRAYLQKLREASDGLSFPVQTGNPVVDILLWEKLGAARALDIQTEVSVVLPEKCGIDALDFCVIFANALDNAVRGCREASGEKIIRISGERQGNLLMLAFENSCGMGALPKEGTGLSNIRAAAEKYHGAVETEKAGGWFSLNVLLDISCPDDGISGQLA